MVILSAIIQLLGGRAMFLYGIELMGDGLKNSSGEALKRVLEKVTGNVVMGVLTGAMVTAVIQSSTATIVLTVALIGAGVLTLKQAVAIVMGANIGTTVTAQIIRLYKYLSDANPKNNFDIEKYLSTQLKTKPDDVYEVVEVDVSDVSATA